MTKSQQQFRRRVLDEWLPAFCADSRRRYDPRVFDPAAKEIGDADSRDFLRAIDSGLAFFGERQRIGMHRGAMCETLFTEGQKKITPRPVYLWVETVLTVAAGARLHFEHGWPIDRLSMQPTKDYAFDLVAYRPGRFFREFIAVEIKPTAPEFAALSANLRLCCAGQHIEDCEKRHSRRINAHRKWKALAARQPSFVWLVGPSPLNETYRLSYRADGVIEADPVNVSELNFSAAAVAF